MAQLAEFLGKSAGIQLLGPVVADHVEAIERHNRDLERILENERVRHREEIETLREDNAGLQARLGQARAQRSAALKAADDKLEDRTGMLATVRAIVRLVSSGSQNGGSCPNGPCPAKANWLSQKGHVATCPIRLAIQYADHES